MNRFVATLLVSGLCVASGFAVSPDPKELIIPPHELLKAREIVRVLGSEDYQEREQAHAELAKMGRLALPTLLEAAKSNANPEVRFRAERLLPKAQAAEHKARFDTFLADKDEKYDHGFPNSKQFQKIRGRDAEARALFIEIMKSPDNRKFLRAIEAEPAEARRVIATRLAKFVDRINNSEEFNLSEIAGLLFAMSLVPDAANPNGPELLQQKAARNTLDPVEPSRRGLRVQQCDGREWEPYKGVDWNYATTHSPAFRRLVKLWIESLTNAQALSEAIKAIGRDPPKYIQTVPLLKRIITTQGVDGDLKVHAIRSLLRDRRGVEDAFFKGSLSDDSLAWTSRWGNDPRIFEIRVQDVVLAIHLVWSGQKLEDYGFAFQEGVGEPTLHDLRHGTQHAFGTAEARTAALVKFGFRQLKQSLKGPANAPRK